MALTNRDMLVLDRLQGFLKSCPNNYHFNLFDDVVTPLPSEITLLEPFLNGYHFSNDALRQVRSEIGSAESYHLVWFAVRMAIHAARLEDPRFLAESFWGACLDEDYVETSDILTALAVIEDCAIRVGVDFLEIVDEWIDITSERRKGTILLNYLGRTIEQRQVEIMGYMAVATEEEGLKYVEFP